MAQDDFVIGQVAGTHGINGDLRVFPLTFDITRFELLTEVSLDIGRNGESMTVCAVESVRYHKKFVLLKLKGIDTIDEAEKLKNVKIKIGAQFALPLEENEYYIRDLVGLDVYTEEGELLGKLTDVIETGANDVYEVAKSLYLPAIKDCVKSVDISGGRMIVKLMEGLR